jgi:hypothetical protein
MAISPDKIIVRNGFANKIEVLTDRVTKLFEYDVCNGIVEVSAITGIISSGQSSCSKSEVLDLQAPKQRYRCKEHKIPCFTVQLYWDKVDCLTKLGNSSEEHVTWIKNRPQAYGPSYDIEPYELIESLREVDNYDPFDIIRIRNFKTQRPPVCEEDDDDSEDENLQPCGACLRMLYRKIPDNTHKNEKASDLGPARNEVLRFGPTVFIHHMFHRGAAAGAGGGK